MSGHTPGPWGFQKDEDCMGRQLDDLVKWVITAEDGDLWISTGPTWDPEHSEESEANARLIAAAPELLEALMNASGVLQSYSTQSKTAEICEKMARAAIAKATGGSE